MPQGNNEKLWIHLKGTIYLATPSNDLTTMVVRRIRDLGGDWTKALKAMIVSAGSKN